MTDKPKAEKSQMEGPAAYAPHDEDEKKGQGIFRDERGQEQPVDKKRAQQTIESWRRHYNTTRPHESLGYKPPAPEVFVPAFAAWPTALRRTAPPATLAQRPTLN